MKERYIALMERTLEAYSREHIERYFHEVRTNGLTEHGFPRLTANLGILIARGRKVEWLALFAGMMDFCCENIPRVKAANDFSVREIIFCLMELEKSDVLPAEKIEGWKDQLRAIVPATCYTQFARTPDEKLFNWALFTAVSEYVRSYAGLGDSSGFVDIQLATQVRHLDENGMYRDADDQPPMMYDLTPRGLFAQLLHFGYRGKYRSQIDEALRKAGLLTLKMQSVTGEIPYGGRSSQFLHNEATLAIVLEYEANRYARAGNAALAGQFKAAVRKAVDNIAFWLSQQPIHHIKNRFPSETGYGCEDYAYFDKYMITTASFLYAAQLICDDEIEETETVSKPYAVHTSDDFHKAFLSAGGYFLEFDTRANPLYDAGGLGRIHKQGAPSCICMSSPCAQNPNYRLDLAQREALSLAPGCMGEDGMTFATSAEYCLRSLTSDDGSAQVSFDVLSVRAAYAVDADGVQITVSGDGTVAHLLPAFWFDGAEHTDIRHTPNSLAIRYQGFVCRYETDGRIADTGKLAASRHGHYRVFQAEGEKTLTITVTIQSEQDGEK